MLGSWSLQTWLVAIGIVVWGAIQYGLAYWTLRDLSRRPRVRGDNKVVWALVILTLPLAGALLYAAIGPTSFLPRPGRPGPRPPTGPTPTDPSP
jgi:hypothetical protein